MKYTSESIPLKPGDRLLIYTDGINEAMDQNREQFGDSRLADAFSETADIQSAEEALESIQSRVHEFTGSEPQHDDLTMVYVRIGHDQYGLCRVLIFTEMCTSEP